MAVTMAERARPEPPSHLTSDHKRIWRQVVNALPADWFGPETYPLLIQYCRHTVRAEKLAILIDWQENNEIPDPRLYTKLVGQELLQSQVLTTLATKMRLAQQSTFVKTQHKRPAGATLWQDADNSNANDDGEEDKEDKEAA